MPSYFVTPRRYDVISTRSKPKLHDRVGLVTMMTAGPPGSSTELVYSKGAYLGFQGVGASVPLTDEMWGIYDGWRMEVPQDKGIIYLSTVARNGRKSDRELRELILKAVSAVAAITGAAALPAKVVEWAAELGISEAVVRALSGTSISGVVDSVIDALGSAVLGDPNCDGEIYRSFVSVGPTEIDTILASGSTSSFEEDGVEVSRTLWTVPAAMPISPQAECNTPVGMLTVELERRTQLMFDNAAVETRAVVMGAPYVPPESVCGIWVEEENPYGPLYRLMVEIAKKDAESDYFTVKVTEATVDVHGAHVFFTQVFENVEMNPGRLPAPPAANTLGAPRQPSPYDVGGGRYFPRPVVPPVDFGEAKMKTERMLLVSGDIGNLSISVWRTSARARQQEIATGLQLNYTRNGLCDATHTRTWLAKRGKIG